MNYDELKALIAQRGVHAVFGDGGEGWGIEQNVDELAQFLVHMQALGVQSVLEIGTGYKAGLARFLHDDMGWDVVSVDIHDYGHQHDGIRFVQMHPSSGLQYFDQYDLVIIDGDHSYEGVQRDFETWGEHATKVIAFHDTCGLRDCEGVEKYWHEIAYERRTLKPGYYEIAADGDQRGGIGYIVLAEVDLGEVMLAGASNSYADPGTVDDELPAKPTPKAEPKKPAPRKPAAKKPAAKAPAKR